jgi:hypothetical protein
LQQQIVLGHRIALLQTMARIIESSVSNVHPEMATEVIQFAAEEMTESKVGFQRHNFCIIIAFYN